MGWTINGRLRESTAGDHRGATVTYRTPDEAGAARKLDQLAGDTELVALLSYDAAVGRPVAATPTSAHVPATLADGAAMFLAASRYFEPGGYRVVEGESGVAVAFVPDGAEA